MKISQYNRLYAVAYAHKWALGRNPAYYDFSDIGGDCTNFASQCIFAGSGVMNFTPTFGWYYVSLDERAPAWTGVKYIYNFLTTNKGAGPFGIEVPLWGAAPGDIVQLQTMGEDFHHTPVIVQTSNPPSLDGTLVAAHSNDAYMRPLSSYSIIKMRCIHILGVRS